MPIFQDDLEHPPPVADCPGATALTSLRQQLDMPSLPRKLSEESIRTELCEGPILESPRPSTPESDAAAVTSDRAELIERLKRGESPTWVPNRHVASLKSAGDTSFTHNMNRLESLFKNLPRAVTPRSPRLSSGSLGLLPAARFTPEKAGGPREDDERLHDGSSIQRSRSALHSGDFTEDQPRTKKQGAREEDEEVEEEGEGEDEEDQMAAAEGGRRTTNFSAPRSSWIAMSPPRDFSAFPLEGRIPYPVAHDDYRSAPSSLSSSLSSSFVYKPPTSPLVQSESHDDIDLSVPLHSIDITASPLNLVDSHQKMPHPPRPVASPLFSVPSTSYHTLHRQYSQRGAAPPYQAHQPRRSLTSAPQTILSGTLTQSPTFPRPRPPSLNADPSPLQHASMVGSYEESILRGRMSTTPSKPLDFLAQIGVLGLGKCKSSLRCPAHVTLPFPAVFYHFGGSSQGRVRSEDGPSPYVGQIDLENGLPNPEEGQRSKRKLQTRVSGWKIVEDEAAMGDGPAMVERSDHDAHRAKRARRRSGSPRAPPGGSYRVPEKGQIQIVIKNPNKTAVKLFLVPYDLSGMEPGTKTFIRQRSYSAGTIIENAPGFDEAAGSDRPILRYLVHLHICCPAKGRYYLYKNIRIVLANRVPDGDEKLRNETTYPEPRYTPYKPIRVMHPPLSNGSGPAAMLAADKAFRRRSAGFSMGQTLYGLDVSDALSQSPQATKQSSSPSPLSFGGNRQPVDAIRFSLSSLAHLRKKTTRDSTYAAEASPSVLSSQQQQQQPPPPPPSPPSLLSSSSSSSSQPRGPTTKDGVESHFSRYEKLNKGDVGYGGNVFAPPFGRHSPSGTEGLLSQRLRSLGVQNHQSEQQQKQQQQHLEDSFDVPG